MKDIDVLKAKEEKKMNTDEKGFFVIFIRENQIIVEHYKNVNKGGKLTVETGDIDLVIKGNSAKAISDTIIREGLVSRLDHMAYLARELQKAEMALIHHLEYEQSKPLKL